MSDILSIETKSTIDHWCAKYPADQKRSAILASLTAVQDQNGGWLNESLLEAVATYLEVPLIWVKEVATFYDMYDLAPTGKHKIRLCTNISCMLSGAEKIACHLKKKLGVEFGETTKDGLFTLKEAECLAGCCGAPMMQVGLDYHEHLTTEKVDKIVEDLKQK
jgi:NADH-quinone oxidoreductase subunit E